MISIDNTTQTITALEAMPVKKLQHVLLERSAELSTWPTPVLQTCWQRLYRISYRVSVEQVPTLNKSRLIKSLLWLVQAQTYGGLDSETQQLLQHFYKQTFTSPPITSKPLTQKPFKAKDLPIGTQLTRHWHGREYQVTVVAKGRFEFAGESYRSLSKIAEAITGSHWSGPRFFGLNQLV